MTTFQIDDMTCGRCAGAIARALAGVDKQARVQFDLSRKHVAIESTAAEAELVEAIREAGYTARPLTSAPAGRPAQVAGCGCGCGPKAAVSAVDMAQAVGLRAKSCCG